MKTKWIWFAGWIIIIMIGIGISVYYKSEIIIPDISENEIGEYPVYISDNYETDDENSPIQRDYNQLSDLENDTQLIVRVRAGNDREKRLECVLTAVNVLQVYKGNEKLINKTIYIYEPVYINTYPGYEYYMSIRNYNLMIPDNEYILFLEFRAQPDGYYYSEKEIDTYLIKGDIFGKYDLDSENEIKVIADDQQTIYKDIRQIDIFTTSKELWETYLQWKKDILVKYN